MYKRIFARNLSISGLDHFVTAMTYPKKSLLTCALFSLILLSFSSVSRADIVLIDYDDGNSSNGIHDSNVLAGGMTRSDGSDLLIGAFAPWVGLSTGDIQFFTNLASGVGSANNFAMTRDRVLGVETGYIITGGETISSEYSWRDASGWSATATVQFDLFYTDDNSITGTATNIFTLNSGPRAFASTWETESGSGLVTDDLAIGKQLFAKMSTNATQGTFSRIDNIFLSVSPASVPEPSSIALLGIASLGLAYRNRRRKDRAIN